MCNTMQEEFFPSFRINQDSFTLIFLWQKNSKYHQTWLKSVNLGNKIEAQHVLINKLKNLWIVGATYILKFIFFWS